MVLPRASVLRGSLRAATFKRAGIQARTSLRGVGQRSYASGHEAKKGSDIPWLIGSIVFTVPAASWLYAQGPTPSEHGHGHDAHKEESAEEAKEESSGEEEKDESSEESQAASDEAEKTDDSEDDSEKKAPGTVPDDAETESKGEKDAKSDVTGAKNPKLDDPSKSKKSEGVPESAKIHGTVDTSRPTKGKKGDSSSEEGESKEDKEE
ncbi:hypothetical protein B0A52_01383 [Exophiala mesophila]|uniref:Uncharacterized protein n=1 Tax=Exophiala mesophila TaxID=212818 RepID=A0A438NHB5_EXOME|nr:hypothetical protein B0A52_01383 [Exophiala mesophila]